LRAVICGARGSTPAPGADFVRYGGHTSCVALAHNGELPSLVIDAGTGIRRLSGLLEGGPYQGAVVLSHLHWDHTQGLPFFQAGDRTDSRVRLLMPEQGDAAEVLSRALSPPHFPIHPDGLRGAWTFDGLEPGEHVIEGFTVLALDIPHKGGRTFGFRVSDGRSTLAYLSDHWPIALGPGPDGFGVYHGAALRLTAGVDLLLHDSQYTAEEFVVRADFGHSTIDYAVGLGHEARVGRLVLFHHDPARTDDELDAIAARWSVDAAAEGMVIDLS